MVIRVQTRDNEPVEKALRRLRKLCNNEGITRTSKAKAYFEKPSERRRRESRERQKAIRLSLRAQRQDVAKLLARRKKARKAARANNRDDGSEEFEHRDQRYGDSGERGERRDRPAFRGPRPERREGPGRDDVRRPRPAGPRAPEAGSSSPGSAAPATSPSGGES